jgi:hypothetical protein
LPTQRPATSDRRQPPFSIVYPAAEKDQGRGKEADEAAGFQQSAISYPPQAFRSHPACYCRKLIADR